MADITREVEEVKREYRERFETLAQENRVLLEREKQRYSLQLAALDRRLEVHQEAYALWWKLIASVYKEEERSKVVMECQEWWIHNRLYLEPKVAQAFSRAYHAAAQHSDVLRAKLGTREIDESWLTIRSAGNIIVEAVQLPGIREGESEYKPVGEKGLSQG